MNTIHELHRMNLDGNNGRQFWRELDALPHNLVVRYAELALGARILQGADFVQMISIIGEYKQSGSWTDKQRRWVAMQVINNWGAIEWMTE